MIAEAWPPVPPRIPEAEVGFGEPQAVGGASTVYTVLGQRKSLLYKRYSEPHVAAELDRLVSKYSGMAPKAAAYARTHLAWPVAAVCDGDHVVGVLVVRAGQEFHVTLSASRTRVRDFNFLLYEKRAEKLGVERATDRQKVELLRGLVDVLSWLDERGLVHEDLAAHNVLWRLDPPSVFVLDCDSLRSLAESSKQPLYTTVDWTDPRVLTNDVDRPDGASTSYVLGLLAARTLVSPYWHPGDTLPADRFPAALTQMVARAHGPAEDRPSLPEWGRALDGALAQTTGTVVEPASVGDPDATKRADHVAFLVGLTVGVALAVFVLVRFV
ncbi:hypothetical protein [Streptosporangium roseum]|uniref:Protein kinase domain-containing protein n=1 Tax=Streptosporangium roseum (strain ATCC 12428 / DSM 43021 / JCM 3005 / KCTC 9067 / NCIMB 10171 / NRRL 2505 / NI 9100) TaxID=479432 RepID=D2AQW8_STRRD|nr:hypothetical protein [Streptosporangium roseum]ACZ86515.1 hypothetical protein Sros_3581 [Streptosporangium roseum DSM 43021]